MTRTMVFDHQVLAQRIMFGAGKTLENVALAAGALGVKNVLLIAAGSARVLGDQLGDLLPVCARISEVEQHVPNERVQTATLLAQESRADVVLTVGGGSAIGLAKMIALNLKLPIIAVPTTFSGSEATQMWGMTTDGYKHTGLDPIVLPRVVVYDSDVYTSLPAPLIAASGMNALAHAIDGFWAPGSNPINVATGIEGVRAIVPGLRGLLAAPDDVSARERAIYGAYMCASSFASTGSGLHHKICHVLGGSFGMPHAQTHAVMIAYVAAANIRAFPELERRMVDVFGDVPLGQALWLLNRELGGPSSLAELGLKELDIDAAVQLVMPIIPKSNPGIATEAEMRSLLHQAWAGTEPCEN